MSFQNNEWNHLAATYDGDTKRVRLFVNGVEAPGYDTGNLSSSSNPPYCTLPPKKTTALLTVGAAYNSSTGDSTAVYPWSGMMDEVRISKVVRYTQSFIPQQTSFVSDSNTVLLLHMDERTGLAASDYVNDASVYGNDGELVADAHVVSSSVPYAPSSGNALSLNGTDQYGVVADTASLNFGADDDFTITMWVNTTGYATQPLLNKRISGTNGYEVYLYYGIPRFRAGSATYVQNAARRTYYGRWHYLMFRRMANTPSGYDSLTVHIDGQYVASGTVAHASISNTDSLYLGFDGTNYYNGMMDEVRIEKGFLADTTVPPEPVRPTSDTRLLLRMDQTTNHTSMIPDISGSEADASLPNGASFEPSQCYMLRVARGPANPDSTYQRRDATNVPLLQYRVTAAGATEDVYCNYIRPDLSGSLDDTLAYRYFRLWRDNNENGTVETETDQLLYTRNGRASNDDGYTYLYMYTTLAPGDSATFLMTVDLNETYAVADSSVQASLLLQYFYAYGAQSSMLAQAIPGHDMTGSKVIIDTTTSVLSFSEGQNNPDNYSAGASADSVVMMQFNLAASSVDSIRIDTVSFTMGGNGSSANIADATLWVDENGNGVVDGLDAELVTVVSPSSPLHFDMPDETWLLPGQARTYMVSYEFTSGAVTDATYSLVMDSVGTTGWKTFSTVVGDSIVGPTVTIGVDGQITLTKGSSNPSSASFGNAAQDVEVLQVKVAVDQVTDVGVASLKIGCSGTIDADNAISSATLAYDVDEDGVYTTNDSVLSAGTFSNGSVTFAGLDRTLGAGKYEYWLVVYDLNGSAEADQTFGATITSNVELQPTGGSADFTVIGAPIIGREMTVANSGSLSITAGPANPQAGNVDSLADNVPMLQVRLTAGSSDGAEVKYIAFTHSGTGDELSDLEHNQFDLYNDVNSNGQVDDGIDEFIATGIGYEAAACSVYYGRNSSETNSRWIADGTESDVLAGEGAATWEFWVKPTAAALTGTRYLYYKPYYRFTLVDGVPQYLLYTAAGTYVWYTLGSTALTADTWTHLAYVYDGENMKVYINGTLTGTQAHTGAMRSNTSVLYMAYTWYGVMDEVRVSDVVRYSGNFSVPTEAFVPDENTVLLYHFDEGGTSVTSRDASQTGADLTLYDGGSAMHWGEHGAGHPIGRTPMWITTTGQTIDAGDSEDWLLTYSYGGTTNASSGETFTALLDSAAHVIVSGATTGGRISPTVSGGSIAGGTMTIGNTGTITLQEGFYNPSDDVIAQAGESDLVMMNFTLTTSSAESVLVDRIVVMTEGSSAAESYLDSVKLVQDVNGNGEFDLLVDSRIDSVMTPYEADTLSFTVGRKLAPGTQTGYLLVGYTSAGANEGDTFLLTLEPDSIHAVGVTSAADLTPLGSKVDGSERTVQAAGVLTVSLGADTPDSSTISADAENVVMLQFGLAASAAETIYVSAVDFTHQGTGQPDTALTENGVAIWRDVNSDGALSTSTDQLLGTGEYGPGGAYGQAVEFDGEGYIEATSVIAPRDSFTVEAWIYPTTSSGNHSIISTRNFSNYQTTTAFVFRLEGLRLSLFYYNTSQALQRINPSAATLAATHHWYHVAGTYDSENSRMRLFIDGVQKGTDYTTTGLPYDVTGGTEERTYVGASYNSADNPYDGFVGRIDEARVSHNIRYMTDFTVASEPFTDDANTLLLYHLDEGTGTATDDASSNNNDGTLDGLHTDWVGAKDAGILVASVNVGSRAIEPGTSENWIVVYDYDGTASDGDRFVATIAEAVDVTATGEGGSTIGHAGSTVTGNAATVSNVGTLTMEEGANNPASSNVSAGAANFPMLQFRLTASSAEDIDVNSITLIAQGTGNDVTELADENAVALYYDANGDGKYNQGDGTIAQGVYSENDGTVTLNTAGQTIPAGASRNWLVCYTYGDSVVNGNTFVTRIIRANINASGATSQETITPAGTSPIAGGTMTGSTEGTLTVGIGTDSPSPRSIGANEEKLEMLQLALSASYAETLWVRSLKIRADGTADEAADIDSVYLYDDLNDNGAYDAGVDTALTKSAAEYTVNNDTVRYVFTGVTGLIPKGGTENWLVLYDLTGSASNNETFQVHLDLANYVAAYDTLGTNARTVQGTPINGPEMTISSIGVLTLAVGNQDAATSNEAAGASGLVMLQLRMTASAAETLLVDSVSFTADGTLDEGVDISAVKIYRDLDDNGELGLTTDTQIDSSRTFTGDNGSVAFHLAVSETLAAGETANWLVVYDLSGTGSGGETFRVRVPTATNFVVKGIVDGVADHDATVMGVPLNGSYKTITTTGALTLEVGSANPGASAIDSTDQNLEMVQFKVTASSVEDIQLLGLGVRHSGTATAATDVEENSIKVYRDENNNGVLDIDSDTYLGNAGRFNGYAINFDVDYITADGDATNFLVGKSAATWEAWIRPDAARLANGMEFLSKAYTRLRIYGGRLYVAIRTSGTSFQYRYLGDLTVTGDEWNHVAVVLSGGVLKGYINGQYSGSVSASGTMYSDAYDMRVGCYYTTGAWFYGDIDEVRVSDVARYTGSFSPPTVDFQPDANTLLLWHFDEGADSTIADASDNAISGVFGSSNEPVGDPVTYVDRKPQWTTGGGAHANNIANVRTPGQTISAGTTENWLVLYDLGGSDTASLHETFTAHIDPTRLVGLGATSGEFVSVAGNTVSGGERTVQTTGSLTLTAGAHNPSPSTIGPDTKDLPMMQVQLTASNAETLLISSFRIKGLGDGDEIADIDSVALVADLNNNGTYEALVDTALTTSKGEFVADNGTVTFTFGEAYSLPAGASRTWLVLYDLAGTASNQETFQARIELASYVTVTGKTTTESITPNVSVPLTGGVKTISNIGQLSISTGANNPGASNEWASAEDVPLLQLHLAATNAETLSVDSIALTFIGTMRHDTCLTSVRLYRDVNSDGQFNPASDVSIAAAETVTDSAGTIRFDVDSASARIAPSGSADWLVLVTLNGKAPDGVTFGVKILANDSVYVYGVESLADGDVLGAPVTSALKTISASGSLTLTEGDNNPTASSVDNSTFNLPVLQFRLTASSAENITVSKFRLRASGTAHDTADIAVGGIKLFNDANANGVYDSGTDVLIAQASKFSADNGYIDFSSLDRTITKGTSQTWLVVYDLNGTASNDETFVAYAQRSEITATGVDSGDPIPASGASTVTGGTQTVSVAGTLTLSLGAGSPEASSASPGEEDVVVMQLQMQASTSESLKVYSVRFKAEGTGDDTLHIYKLHLWDDLNANGLLDIGVDSVIADSNAYSTDNGLATFNIADGYVFAPNTAHRWLLVYNLETSIPNGRTFQATIPLNSYVVVKSLSGEAREVYGAQPDPIQSAVRTISNIGTMTLSLGTSTPGAGEESKSAEGVVMMQLHLAASAAETLVVDSIRFNASGTLNDLLGVSAVRIYKDITPNGQLDPAETATRIDSARTFAADNDTVRFSAAVAETLAPSTSQDWLVIYDLAGTGTPGQTFRVSLSTNAQVAVTGISGGNHAANVTGAPVNSSYMTITSSGALTLSAGSANPVSGTIDSVAQDVAMAQFRLQASTVEDIDVLGVAVRHTGSAEPRTDVGSVSIYNDVNNNGALDLGTDVYLGNASGGFSGHAVSFTADDYIYANGPSTNFLAEANAATWECWAYPTTTTGARMIYSKGYMRILLNNGILRVYIRTNLYANWVDLATEIAPVNQWNHIAVVLNGGVLKGYVNGQLTGQADVPGNLYSDDYEMHVGTQYNGTGYPFEGAIDELRISSVARYTTNFTVPKADFQPDGSTLLLWHLDEGAGTTVGDAADNNITGYFAADPSTPTWATGGGDHALNVANVTVGQRTIPAGASQNWLVIYDLGGSDTAATGETFTSWIDLTRIQAIGATSQATVSINGNNVNGGEKTVSQTGALTVNAGSNNPASSSVGPGDSAMPMLQIQLSASNAENLLISEFKVKASGTGDDVTDVDSLLLVADLNSNGTYEPLIDSLIVKTNTVFSGDDGVATFTISPDYVLTKGTNVHWLIAYAMQSSITNGKTFRASIELATYFTVEGATTTETITPAVNVPLNGGLMTVSNVGVVTIATGEDNPGTSNEGAGAADIPLLQLKLTASNAETLRVDSIAANMIGTLSHDTGLTAIKLYRDLDENGAFNPATDYAIANDTTAADSGIAIHFVLNTDDRFIAPNETQYWLVMADLASDAPGGQTFGVKVQETDSIWVYGVESLTDASYTGGPITSSLKTVSTIGSLTLQAGPNNPSSNIDNGSSDLAMLQVRLATSSAEAIIIREFKLRASGTANDTADIEDSGIRVYKDVNSNGAYEATTDQLLAQAVAYNQDNGWITFSSFNHTIPAGTIQDWLVVYDLNGNASNGETFIASIYKSDIVAEGATSSQSITTAGSSVSGGTITVSAEGTMTIALGPNTPTASTVAPLESNVVMAQIQLSASTAETLLVTQLKIKAEGTGNDLTDVTNIEVWDDLDGDGSLDTGVDTAIVSSGAFSADNGILTHNFGAEPYRFLPSTQHRWLLVYDLAGSISNGVTFRATLPLNSYVTATNTSSVTRTVSGAPLSGALKTVDNVGTITMSAGPNNPLAGNEGKSAQNVVMLQLRLAASAAETLVVDSINITGSGTINDVTDISAVKLYRDVDHDGELTLVVDSQIDSARFYLADNGAVMFSKAVSETLAPSTSEDWLIVYDLANSADAGETFRAAVQTSGHVYTTGIAGGAHEANVTGPPVYGNYMTVTSTGELIVSEGSSNPGASNVDSTASNVAMLQINLAATSVEDIDILGLGVRHTGSADPLTDVATGSVELYRDVNGNGTLDEGTDVYLGNAPSFNGHALDFGYRDRVSAPSAETNFLYNRTSATWEAWLYPTTTTGRRTFLCKGYQRLSLNAGKVEAYVLTYGYATNGSNAYKVLGNATVTANQWNHVAVVYDGSHIRAYINGVKTTTTDSTHTGAIYSDAYDLFVGTWYNGYSYDWNGMIDEVRISDIARYDDNFTAPKADFHPDDHTLLLWHFDEGLGTTANDASATGANGTLSNYDDAGAAPDWVIGGGQHADDIANIDAHQRTISAGTSENWLVVYDLGGSDTATIGETFTSWVDMERVVAVGRTSGDYVDVTGVNVSGGTKTVSAEGTLSLYTGSHNPASASVGVGIQNQPMLHVQLAASNAETLLISKFKVKAYGTGDDSAYVDSVRLVADVNDNGVYDDLIDSVLSTARPLEVNDSTVTFTFSPAYVLPKGQDHEWLVTYDMNDTIPNGKTFQARIVLASYVAAVGKQSGATIVPDASYPLSGGLMTVSNIGVLTASKGSSSPATSTESASALNVPVLQIHLAASNAETLRVDSLSVKLIGTVNHGTAVSYVKLYNDVNSNGQFDAATDIQISPHQTIADSAGSVRFRITTTETDSLIPPATSVDWLVLVSLNGSATHGETFGARVMANDSIWTTGAESHQGRYRPRCSIRVGPEVREQHR